MAFEETDPPRRSGWCVVCGKRVLKGLEVCNVPECHRIYLKLLEEVEPEPTKEGCGTLQKSAGGGKRVVRSTRGLS